jgi:NADH-quinone oxidoreductase subunit A
MNCLAIILLPPVTFAVIILALVLFNALISKLAYKSSVTSDWKTRPYSCGEEVTEHRIQPDYSRFFPFAFLFTIMHVVVLMIATSPDDITSSLGIIGLFLIVAFLGLFILFRD